MSLPFKAYESGEYLVKNPTWDIEDSEWKAAEILKILNRNKLFPKKIVEVGCGAGGILVSLQNARPKVKYSGYEIASSAEKFWGKYKDRDITFKVEDFLHAKTPHFDILLMLDVIEHLPNLFDFLTALKGRSNYYIFHIPLDLSAISVLREMPLLKVRKKVGHIHYFTKGLALALLDECNFDVLDWHYTGASFSAPQVNWKTKLANLPRRLVCAINRDVGIRLLGGDTLIVLAKEK